MKNLLQLAAAAFFMIFAVTGCGRNSDDENGSYISQGQESKSMDTIVLSDEITELEKGLSAVKHSGNYGFDEFLEQGGASSDREVVDYLMDSGIADFDTLLFGGNPFGCSTLSAKDENGNSLFGRNFDWNSCNAMIIQNVPDNGYASISTVNMDFINMSGIKLSSLPDNIQALAGLYAPLDGLNEKGLAVSVNMIQDSDTIEQNTDKPDITTTTAVRLLLDKAANTEEAARLLNSYDMHASFGYMVHFAIADSSGNSIVAEYLNNELVITETPVVTNFYLAAGEKYGIGTEQSHERYDILMELLSSEKVMNMNEMRNALDSVSKDNFKATPHIVI